MDRWKLHICHSPLSEDLVVRRDCHQCVLGDGRVSVFAAGTSDQLLTHVRQKAFGDIDN